MVGIAKQDLHIKLKNFNADEVSIPRIPDVFVMRVFWR